MFNIQVNGQDAGFVFIGNSLDEYPVLSFSYEGKVFDDIQRNSIRKTVKGEIVGEKMVSLGAGRFALQFEMKNGNKIIKAPNGSKLFIHKVSRYENADQRKRSDKEIEKARLFWKHIFMSVAEIGNDHDGVTNIDPSNWETGYDSMNRNYISNVPDINQWQYEEGQWTGCAPTAGSNVMAYWANKDTNYQNLMPTTQEDVVMALRETMGTTQTSDGAGSTKIYNIDDGMRDYAHNQGLTNATSKNFGNWFFGTSVSYADFKNEIDAQRPNLLSFIDQTYYGEHTVTGVGYKEYVYNGSSNGHQYMVIHDNWSTTTRTIYVAYGRDYNYVVMTQFIPS